MGLPHLNVTTWIDENKKFFLPPVCNKMMHGDGQLKIFYVGGPNIRKDFHLEEGEELFYMVKGDMVLIILENGEFNSIPIKEGEVFLLPGRVPHSPQRCVDTVGLVIERERLKEEKDCLRYFIGDTKETLFEKWFYCENLGTQIGPVIREYFASEQHKTGKPIPGDITTDPPWYPDNEIRIEKPFLLSEWLKTHRKEISDNGIVRLFNKSYQSDIEILGENRDAVEEKADIEIWIWQIEGNSTVFINDEEIKLKPQDSYLISSNATFKHIRPAGCIAMSVKMDPKRNQKLGMKQ